MSVHFGDTPEGEKISKELDRCLEKRLAYEDEKMWKSIFIGVISIISVIPIAMSLAWIIQGGNL